MVAHEGRNNEESLSPSPLRTEPRSFANELQELSRGAAGFQPTMSGGQLRASDLVVNGNGLGGGAFPSYYSSATSRTPPDSNHAAPLRSSQALNLMQTY